MLFRFDFWFLCNYSGVQILQTVTCKNHVFSDSGIMIAPEPGTNADSNFRLPKQTATVY